MACPTCGGFGYLEVSSPTTGYPPPHKEPCPNPDCPHAALEARVVKGVKVVNLAPNQDWSAYPVLFEGDKNP